MPRRTSAVVSAAMAAVAVAAGAAAPAVSAADGRLSMHGCTDSSLLFPIEPSRAAAVVPPAYTVSVTAGHAFLYVSTMRCDAIRVEAEQLREGALQLVSVGVAAPGSTGGVHPPIGPGRRDSYLLAALTDHPGLLQLARRAGVPAVAGSATVSVAPSAGLLRHLDAEVAGGLAPLVVTGDATEVGSPVHQHELHYWHDARELRAHMELDVEMVDRPGVGQWETPPGSLIARLADDTDGSTFLFLNSNEISGALSSQHRQTG